MAKTQKGLNAITVSLIVFVGLWLASTVGLIILYTYQEELRNLNTDLRKKNSTLISSSEQSLEYVKQMGVGDQTAVGLIEAARGDTAALATGDPKDDPATVATKRRDALDAIQRGLAVSNPASFKEVSFLEALNKLSDEYKRENTSRVEGDKRIAELEGQLENLRSTSDKERKDFETRSAELAEKLRQSEDSRAKFRDDREKHVASIENDFKGYREQNDAQLAAVRKENATVNEQLAQSKERVAALYEKFSDLIIGPEELSTARKSDGVILTAVPGDDVVYIDLGNKDRLVLGMQFAVYPAEGIIPADGVAKAQIEVVAIGESASECKIVRVTRNHAILQGDTVANPVYDRNRPQSFVIAGDFDLNRDGQADPAGFEAVKAMVEEWGGKIENDPTALTDFVVLGRTPVRAASAGTAQTEEQRYNKIRDTANSLSIPILTQEVFLNFLGFSNRYAQR